MSDKRSIRWGGRGKKAGGGFPPKKKGGELGKGGDRGEGIKKGEVRRELPRNSENGQQLEKV